MFEFIFGSKLDNIAKALCVQSANHAENISSYYKVMYDACYKEFYEDNDITLKSFLLEQFMKSINGRKSIYCDTVKEAWAIIGDHPMGTLYQVLSPTGKDVSEFIPF